MMRGKNIGIKAIAGMLILALSLFGQSHAVQRQKVRHVKGLVQKAAVVQYSKNAHTLLQQIRQQLQPLMDRITHHPYLSALEEGRVPRESFRIFAAQQYRIVSNGIKNIALLVSRYGDQPSRTQLNGFLQAEFSVIEALMKWAKALGMNEEDLRSVKPLPGALTFSTYESVICLYGTDADLITAFLFDAEVWIHNALRVSRALQSRYGFSRDAVEFFEMYANYQPSAEAIIPYVQAAIDNGEPPAQIAEATYLLLSYELDFWDAMAEAAGIAPSATGTR